MVLAANGDAIEVRDLYKRYGQLTAVGGLSFTVGAGEVFGMLGPNGAGKTTTVEIMVGLRGRDSGHVRVLGLDPGRQPRELKTRIGVQLQTAALFPRLTVREVIRLFGSFYPSSLPVDDVIALVGLQEKAAVQVKDLSGGQTQRLVVATAMVSDGELIFLDEPTTGLDPQARRNLWEVILNLKARGKTIFMTTHYMDEAEKLCDRVAVVDHGRVIALGSPRQLIEANFQEIALELTQSSWGMGQLDNLPGVSRVEEKGDVVTLYTTSASQTIAALINLTGESGLPLGNVTMRQATLEDVFLKLTGRRIRQ